MAFSLAAPAGASQHLPTQQTEKEFQSLMPITGTVKTMAGNFKLDHSFPAPGEAEKLYKQALAIATKAQAGPSQDVALLTSNLADVYKAQARYDEAEAQYKRALEMAEKAVARSLAAQIEGAKRDRLIATSG